MKRILHVSKYYYPFRGGTEQIARDCVNALKNDYEQMVICFNSNKDDETEKVDGINIVRCGCFAKMFSQPLSLTYKNRFCNLINSFEPDIIIFHYPNPFVATMLLKFIKNNSKLVVYWHLDIVKQKLIGKLFKRQNKRILSRANRIVATSPNYVNGSPWLSSVREKCIVIPNCINEQRLQKTNESMKIAEQIKKVNKDKIICLSVGRHTEYKGFRYLIEASKLLDDRFQFFITGRGELTKSLMKEASNDKKIHFLGTVSDDELKSYLLAMDIFCFPSITKNEAFGLALAEAMYYAKPSVTFTIPGSGVNYVCIGGENGIEVENRNVEAYADALRKLADDCELRKKYGLASRQRVLDNFLNSQFNVNIRHAIEEL